MKNSLYNVVIIGGGASGSAAGIQAARMGVSTLIIEETPWLGGMITAAGVSAFDGNKFALGGGIFGELRKKLEQHYGGPEKTFTGWISLTCFEPKIGKTFLQEIASNEKKLDIWFNFRLLEVKKENNKILSVIVKNELDDIIEVFADVFIEATEFGDVLSKADIPYRLGRDSIYDTGEIDAPEQEDFCVQDITFCATLKNYIEEAPKISPSANYNEKRFLNSIVEFSDTDNEEYLNHKLHNWNSFISYAALPNSKYLLNWPFRANDYPTTEEIYEAPETRSEHFRKAKELTLDFIHFMQEKCGHSEWGLATDEYGTGDNLPFIPYVRESRRVKGVYLMVENDVIPYRNSYRPKLRKDSIAVGDYFLDHHHSLFFKEPHERLIEKLPNNAPFQVPFYSLIPENTDGLIVAEKSISVSHIVNGCTRLQPVVMLIGQAAGAIAALASINKIEPRNVSVNETQKILIDAGCQLFPYKDVFNNEELFKPSQYLALIGIFHDDSDFSFMRNDLVTRKEIESFQDKLTGYEYNHTELIKLIGLRREEVYEILYEIIQ